MAKFRNRKKHGFKRLRKQIQVYDYCKTRIERREVFTITNIAEDLKMARSTVIELLQELTEQNKGLKYKGGCIEIIGLGNNGYTKADNQGVVTKSMKKTTHSRLEKKNRVYSYLIDLVNNNKPIPTLSEMSKDFPDMHMTTLMDILKNDLDKENKIVYRRGKVVLVNVPSFKNNGETIRKYNHSNIEEKIEEKVIEPIEELPIIKYDIKAEDLKIESYDKAVKDLIADYILNADITTREDIISYVDSIMKITDKLKDKLFK